MSEHDTELERRMTLSDADDVLRSGTDTVAAEEPQESVDQVGETLGEATGQPGDDESSETLDFPLADLRPALEAVLMVADQPLDHVTLATAVGYPPGEVSSALHGLADEYAEQGRGFDLRNVAGGWRFYTREEYAGSWSASCSTGSRPGSPRRRSRRWPWWPTSSRSAAPGCRPSAA